MHRVRVGEHEAQTGEIYMEPQILPITIYIRTTKLTSRETSHSSARAGAGFRCQGFGVGVHSEKI